MTVAATHCHMTVKSYNSFKKNMVLSMSALLLIQKMLTRVGAPQGTLSSGGCCKPLVLYCKVPCLALTNLLATVSKLGCLLCQLTLSNPWSSKSSSKEKDSRPTTLEAALLEQTLEMAHFLVIGVKKR